MARNPNPVFELAYWFVTEFLGQEWSRNIHLMHLSHAKQFLNPKKDPDTGKAQTRFTPEQIKGCLKSMRMQGVRNINTLRSITWVDKGGKSYLQKYLEPEPPPPLYMAMEREVWECRQAERM